MNTSVILVSMVSLQDRPEKIETVYAEIAVVLMDLFFLWICTGSPILIVYSYHLSQ